MPENSVSRRVMEKMLDVLWENIQLYGIGVGVLYD